MVFSILEFFHVKIHDFIYAWLSDIFYLILQLITSYCRLIDTNIRSIQRFGIY